MKLVDLYTKEFQRAIINQSVAHLIETGKIRVNGVIKSPDYVIKNGDRLSHIKHRHEIPVLADKIKVIYEDDDYVVVDKPCSIPIHPCGKFRYNTLSIILIKEMGYKNLRSNSII
jgi:tRNA pseudouridine synthase 8/2,5-diamino-6-(5-phospho-D-ribitylamino)-pyrimidin-4(3H)-one deaminase